MRVKICGITTLEDALVACDAGADALGFNFAEEAKPKFRYVSPQVAADIVSKLPPFVTTVAVTVNESVDTLKRYLEFVDFVQLHGEESPATCAAVAKKCIKAFRVTPGFDPYSMLDYPAAAYLLDASIPGQRGGTGAICDWDAARRAVAMGKSIVLAGGLNAHNVADAIAAVHPQAVDTASGVESAPGKKDHEQIRNFIRNAKARLS